MERHETILVDRDKTRERGWKGWKRFWWKETRPAREDGKVGNDSGRQRQDPRAKMARIETILVDRDKTRAKGWKGTKRFR